MISYITLLAVLVITKRLKTSNLVRHMNGHTGGKPFACNNCDYKGANKSYLVQHTKIHTSEKPFSGNYCDYKSHHQRALATHIKGQAHT